jgi:hypothetical protein
MHREALGDAIGAQLTVGRWRSEGRRSTYNMMNAPSSTIDKTDKNDQSIDGGQDNGRTTGGGEGGARTGR